MKENLYTTDCIRTLSGIYINVFDPSPEMIDIDDIAHSLSHQCRFAGHLQEFYSVAQHSWVCSTSVSKEHALAALLHDASEAYLLDIPSPIKNRIPQYREIENNLMKVISLKFGFQYPLPHEVKEVDHMVLEIEWESLVLRNNPLLCFTPKAAKALFLERFHALNH